MQIYHSHNVPSFDIVWRIAPVYQDRFIAVQLAYSHSFHVRTSDASRIASKVHTVAGPANVTSSEP